jgi:predicted TIM-barrel fold metal-dependent hydrolase
VSESTNANLADVIDGHGRGRALKAAELAHLLGVSRITIFKHAAREGVDHVLLGSDFPQFTLGETLAAFEELNLTPEEKKIRYQNARTLFGRTP